MVLLMEPDARLLRRLARMNGLEEVRESGVCGAGSGGGGGGGGATAASAAASAAAAAANNRRSNVVKEVERLKKNREERRQRQAELKEEKEAMMNQDPGNPNWEFLAMIRSAACILLTTVLLV